MYALLSRRKIEDLTDKHLETVSMFDLNQFQRSNEEIERDGAVEKRFSLCFSLTLLLSRELFLSPLVSELDGKILLLNPNRCLLTEPSPFLLPPRLATLPPPLLPPLPVLLGPAVLIPVSPLSSIKPADLRALFAILKPPPLAAGCLPLLLLLLF